VHVLNEKLRFGPVESGASLAPFHEVRGLRQIPGALSLVENDNSVVRNLARLERSDSIITEMVDVLDEGLDLLTDLALSRGSSFSLSAIQFVSGQCLPKHLDKRPVAREKHSMRRILLTTMSRREVQPDEGLPGARHACHESNRFEPVTSCG